MFNFVSYVYRQLRANVYIRVLFSPKFVLVSHSSNDFKGTSMIFVNKQNRDIWVGHDNILENKFLNMIVLPCSSFLLINPCFSIDIKLMGLIYVLNHRFTNNPHVFPKCNLFFLSTNRSINTVLSNSVYHTFSQSRSILILLNSKKSFPLRYFILKF